MTTDTLEKSIKQAVPCSLDDIIRKRRDELSLRLSTAEDFAELPSMVSALDNQKQIKATINGWRVICLDNNGRKKHMLTGINEATGHVLATSLLKSVDLGNDLLLTENSIYRLGTKGEGEPTFHELLHLCYMFHSWGFGARFGVPEIFY